MVTGGGGWWTLSLTKMSGLPANYQMFGDTY